MQNPNLGQNKFNKGVNTKAEGTNTQTAADDKPFIEITEHSKFPSTVDCTIMSTKDLSLKFSEILSAAYSDFAGCIMTPTATQAGTGMIITCYFMPKEAPNGGKKRAFTVNDNSGEVQMKSSILQNLVAAESRMKATTVFKPTAAGSRGLSRYMFDAYTTNNGKDVNWGMLASQGAMGEKADAEFGVLQVVTGVFDINKILHDIYGTRSNNGDVYQYSLTPIRPQSSVGTISNATTDWLLMLTRFEMKQMSRVAQQCGIVGTGTSTTQMIGRI